MPFPNTKKKIGKKAGVRKKDFFVQYRPHQFALGYTIVLCAGYRKATGEGLLNRRFLSIDIGAGVQENPVAACIRKKEIGGAGLEDLGKGENFL